MIIHIRQGVYSKVVTFRKTTIVITMIVMGKLRYHKGTLTKDPGITFIDYTFSIVKTESVCECIVIGCAICILF